MAGSGRVVLGFSTHIQYIARYACNYRVPSTFITVDININTISIIIIFFFLVLLFILLVVLFLQLVLRFLLLLSLLLLLYLYFNFCFYYYFKYYRLKFIQSAKVAATTNVKNIGFISKKKRRKNAKRKSVF